MAAGLRAKAALAAARVRAAWASEDDGLSLADAALLKRIDKLCPEGLVASDRPHESWDLAEVSGGGEEDGWIQADEHSFAVVVVPKDDAAHLAAARAAADAIERELRWYFQDRSSRFLGRVAASLHQPGARAVFARRLRRFAASSLRTGDRRQLALWCEFLGRVVAARPFSEGSLLLPSSFERCLAACLARLQGLRRQLEEEDRLQLAVCEESKTEVATAVARRGGRDVFRKARLQKIALCRCALRARRSAALSRSSLASLPGLGSVLRLDRSLSGALLAAAGAEFAGQIFGDLRALADGEADACVLAEDLLVSAASASAVAVGRAAVGRFAASRLAFGLVFAAAGGGSLSAVAAVLELVGPSAAAFLAGALAREAAHRLWGPPGARALRCAYETLGLSPRGAAFYSPGEIEAQLAWMLQQPGPAGHALRLWAAYAYVREHQHPGLRDPWCPPSGLRQEGLLDTEGLLDADEPLAMASARRVLGLDPDSPHTAAELRKRYLQLLLVRHPDKPTGSPAAFLQLRAAYELLRRRPHAA